MRALDGGGGGVEGQKKEGEQRRKLTQVRRASGRLPHLLSYCERSRRRVQLGHQSEDVMGSDSPFLTRGAVDVTLSRSGTLLGATC